MMAICEVCWRGTLSPHLVNGRTTCGRQECNDEAARRTSLETSDRKYSDEYNRGYDDATIGCPRDYGQPTTALMMDYIAGYKQGKRDRAKDKENER